VRDSPFRRFRSTVCVNPPALPQRHRRSVSSGRPPSAHTLSPVSDDGVSRFGRPRRARVHFPSTERGSLADTSVLDRLNLHRGAVVFHTGIIVAVVGWPTGSLVQQVIAIGLFHQDGRHRVVPLLGSQVDDILCSGAVLRERRWRTQDKRTRSLSGHSITYSEAVRMTHLRVKVNSHPPFDRRMPGIMNSGCGEGDFGWGNRTLGSWLRSEGDTELHGASVERLSAISRCLPYKPGPLPRAAPRGCMCTRRGIPWLSEEGALVLGCGARRLRLRVRFLQGRCDAGHTWAIVMKYSIDRNYKRCSGCRNTQS
jgi:hypothetical protein